MRVVISSPVTEGKSKINLRIEYEPKGMVEKTGDMIGIVSQRVERDLKRFGNSIESREHETEVWRGNVR